MRRCLSAEGAEPWRQPSEEARSEVLPAAHRIAAHQDGHREQDAGDELNHVAASLQGDVREAKGPQVKSALGLGSEGLLLSSQL